MADKKSAWDEMDYVGAVDAGNISGLETGDGVVYKKKNTATSATKIIGNSRHKTEEEKRLERIKNLRDRSE